MGCLVCGGEGQGRYGLPLSYVNRLGFFQLERWLTIVAGGLMSVVLFSHLSLLLFLHLNVGISPLAGGGE